MSVKKKTKTKSTRKTAYLTKRILVQAAHAGGKLAAKNALKTMGYSIVAENGWVVKKDAEGKIIETLHAIPAENGTIVLD
jgi:hypothetical protein